MTDEQSRSDRLALLDRARTRIVRWPGWTFVIIGALLVFMVLSKVPLP